MRYLIIVFLLGCFYSGFSQGSLEFSRVLQVNSAVQTVPAGKIWKVEGALYSRSLPLPHCTGSSSCGTVTQSDNIIVNSQTITIRQFNSRGDYDQVNSMVWESSFPLWFEAGTTIQASAGVYSVTIIEFNVVP